MRFVLAILATLQFAAASEVPSGHRVALLIGNAKYEGFTLAPVTASLDRVEEALARSGFIVTRAENLKGEEQKKTAEAFARGMPTNGIALIYYIGLGANVERLGKHYNLLRPVGEKIGNDGDYRKWGLNMSALFEVFQKESGARTVLMFADASWESPIKPDNKNVVGGLRAFAVPAGGMVMYAAPSLETVPVPNNAAPTPMASVLAQNVSRLEVSLKECAEAMAKVTKGWSAGATEVGIGTQTKLPVADSLREGKSAGEGFVNSVGMSFRWCPPGSFTMGTERANTAATRDRAPVKVTLSKGFWMGEHEVTQREYYAVARRNPPAGFTVHPNAPYWGVSEAKSITDFCKKLNDLERKAGRLPSGWEYGAPTEAEWEYACRAGSDSAFSFGDNPAELGLYGNFADAALRRANPDYHWAGKADDGVGERLAWVGSYRPNAWGLRDMHGNVAEVVADHYVAGQPRPGGKDPLVRVKKDGRNQIRGGAWCSTAEYCESTFRSSLSGGVKYNHIGFRVVLKKVK